MNADKAHASKKVTGIQLLGWTPLLITVVGATIVVVLSVLRNLSA